MDAKMKEVKCPECGTAMTPLKKLGFMQMTMYKCPNEDFEHKSLTRIYMAVG